jgi:hypothetical protein
MFQGRHSRQILCFSFSLLSKYSLEEVTTMADQELRDRNNRLIGKIRLVGSRYEGRDANNYLKGTYDPKTDETRDANNRLVGKGNLLSSLITQL